MQRQKAIKLLRNITLIGIYGGLLMPLILIPGVIYPYTFSKILFFQTLIGLSFPAYLMLAWAEPQYRPRKSYVYFALLAYIASIGLSTIFSADIARSWWSNQERMNGLFALLHFLAWLTMTISLMKTWEQWRRLLDWQVALGFVMACVTLIQTRVPDLLIFTSEGRVGGLLGNPIYQGAYQLFILFFSALLFLKTKSTKMRIWYAAVTISSCLTLIASGSRGPFIGLVVGCIVSAVTLAILHQNKKVRLTVIGLILAAGLFYIGMVTVGVKTNAFESFAQGFPNAARMFMLDTGTSGRFIAWKIAWLGFLQRPITGWGYDNFHTLFNANYNPESLRYGYFDSWFTYAHNTVLDVLSTTGIIGLITFFAFWFLLFKAIIHAKRNKYIDIPITAVLIGLSAGYFFQNLFVFDQPGTYGASYLLFALVICTGFASFAEKSEVEDDAKVKSVPLFIYGILQIVFLILIYFTSILPLKASSYVVKANDSTSITERLNYFALAADTRTPYLDDQAYLTSQTLMSLADQGGFEKIPREWKELFNFFEDIQNRYLAAHGADAQLIYLYGNTLDRAGRAMNDENIINKAEETYEKAISLSPKRQQLFFSYGQLLIQTERIDEGLEKYRTAALFDPEVGEAWWYVGMAYAGVKNSPEEAAMYLERAMTVQSPFILRSTDDAYFLAEAYKELNDAKGMKELVDQLPELSNGTVLQYLHVASQAEQLGLIEERDKIIKAVIEYDANSKQYLEPYLSGEVKTIHESIKITSPQEAEETRFASAAIASKIIDAVYVLPKEESSEAGNNKFGW